MDAGLLRERVTIQQRQATATPDGQTEVWTDVATRCARVVPLDARARAAYQQLRAEATHRVILRAPVDLSLADHRFLWRGRVLVPAAPPEDPDGSGRFVTMVVAEG